MSPPAREYVVTYGSLSVSPDAQIHWSDQFDAFTLDFAFLVTGTSAADFATNIAAAQAAFRKPFQDLTVALGASTLYSFKASDNTGLETRPSIVNEDHDANTGRSARLTVRIVGGRPAANAPTSGLREYGVSQARSPNGRKLVTLSGVFTAVGATGARAGYNAAIDALASAAKTACGVTTWELIGEPTAASSYNDQTLTFSRDYQEIKYGQGGSGDDATIFMQQLRVSYRRTSSQNAPGGPFQFLGSDGYGSSAGTAGDAVPLIEVSAHYEAWVAFGTDGFTKWASLRSFVLGVMKSASPVGGAVAIVSENVEVLEDDNRLTVQVTGLAAPGGAIRREYSEETATDSGIVRVPAWKGGPKTKYAYQGPSTTRTTRTLVEDVASGGGSGGASSAAAGGDSGATSGGVDRYAGGTSGFGFGFTSFVGRSFQDLFGQTFGSEIDGTSSGQSGSTFFDAPVAGKPGGDNDVYRDPSNQGGGANGGGGAQASSGATDLVSDSKRTERMSIGIENAISITRTTRRQVVETYSRLGAPAAFGSGPGT